MIMNNEDPFFEHNMSIANAKADIQQAKWESETTHWWQYSKRNKIKHFIEDLEREAAARQADLDYFQFEQLLSG